MSAPLVLVGGENLTDLVVGLDGTLSAHVGGASLNVARGVARLGGRSALLGHCSEDVFGRRARRALLEDGVELDLLRSTSLPSALAVAELDADGAAGYHFHLQGTAVTMLDEDVAAAALAAEPAAIHVGGLALGLEPVGNALETLVAAAPPSALVLLDPNCRPGALPDDAAHRERLLRLLGRTDVVKASVEDLAVLFPGIAALDAAHELRAHGPSCVAVTDGGRSTLVVTADAVERVPVPAATVRDTVGAGDAFCAALLRWWTESGVPRPRKHAGELERLVPAVRWASRIAALTCERDGALPPTLADLEGLSASRP